jgi:hypothetical protein
MAGQYDFTIKQGATFQYNMIWKDSDGVAIDLDGYTARMQIRKDYEKELYIELTTENDRITLNNETGHIDLYISAADTEDLDFKKGRYDLELITGTTVYRILEGIVLLNREVTIPSE